MSVIRSFIFFNIKYEYNITLIEELFLYIILLDFNPLPLKKV